MGGGLTWCGKCIFPIYIYERIPMTMFSDSLASSPVAFIAVTLVVTLAIASLYRFIKISL